MKITVDDIELELLVGADPEIFVSKNNKLISAHGLVKGSKDSPYKVPKGAIQVDGMALEFNIEPAKNAQEFKDNVKEVMKQLQSHIPKDYSLEVQATADFGKEYIDSQPLVAKELGCSSDMNAYTGKDNPKPNAEVPFRTAAGHLHLGWTDTADIKDPEHLELCCGLTKVLDLYLGIHSVFKDPDVKRRSLYGAAGAFRPKSYGLEYRVLSNFWLKSDAEIKWAYDQVVKAVTEYLKGFRVEESLGLKITKGINNSDKQLLVKTLNEVGIQHGL